MKLKTTKRQIKKNIHPENLFAVGYCDLQYLLKFENAFAYSSGVYGWSCDYYEIEYNNQTYIISTGYNPIGNEIDYYLIESYEKRASLLCTAHQMPYEERKKAMKRLLNEFMFKATNQAVYKVN
jgi:effector-binding domain-containing protein